MLEHVQLTEQFQELLEQQRQAMSAYNELAKKFDDPQIREEIDQLCKEKLRHIALTERLLEIVQ